MNKGIIILVAILIIAIGGVLIITSQDDDTSTTTQDGNTTAQEGNVTEGTEEKSSTEDTENAAVTVDNLSYETISSQNGEEISSSKVWLKGDSMKIETEAEGQTSVVIIDGSLYISYIVGEKTAMKMDYENQEIDETPLDTDKVTMDDADENDTITKNLGDETVDGKICSVTQYSLPGSEDYSKVWIWKEKNLMIKMEVKSGNNTMTTEYKNLEIGKVKDSDFEVPKGVEVVDMMEEMPEVPEM